MRCTSCNKILNYFESTRKIQRDDGSVSYPDLCNKCFKLSGLSSIVPIVERYDLMNEVDHDDEECDDICT